jgi:hypothetical protein
MKSNPLYHLDQIDQAADGVILPQINHKATSHYNAKGLYPGKIIKAQAKKCGEPPTKKTVNVTATAHSAVPLPAIKQKKKKSMVKTTTVMRSHRAVVPVLAALQKKSKSPLSMNSGRHRALRYEPALYGNPWQKLSSKQEETDFFDKMYYDFEDANYFSEFELGRSKGNLWLKGPTILFRCPRNKVNMRNIYLELYASNFNCEEWLENRAKKRFDNWSYKSAATGFTNTCST